MYKYILAVVFVASASTACLAAQEFYVVQDAKTKDCQVEHEKPDGVQKIMIGTAYATRAEAKTAKKAAPECNAPKPPKPAQ